MRKKIQQFFSFWVPKRVRIEQSAAAGLDMFRQAIAQLQAASAEAVVLRGENSKQIEHLQKENQILEELTFKNDKITQNIKQLIGE